MKISLQKQIDLLQFKVYAETLIEKVDKMDIDTMDSLIVKAFLKGYSFGVAHIVLELRDENGFTKTSKALDEVVDALLSPKKGESK